MTDEGGGGGVINSGATGTERVLCDGAASGDRAKRSSATDQNDKAGRTCGESSHANARRNPGQHGGHTTATRMEPRAAAALGTAHMRGRRSH